MEEIFTRRSVRTFLSKPVEPEKINKLLRAAMQAPSAANQQPWEFIVVQDRKSLEKLSMMSPYSKPVMGSAVTFVLLGNLGYLNFTDDWEKDMGAVAENILLEATHLGLGSVWIGATNSNSAEYVKEMFCLPEAVHPFALIVVGYPDGQKNEFVDRYKQERVHLEKY